MHKQPKFRAAFTIVELLIVVSVIAVLAGIVTFTAVTVQKTSRDSARNSQANIIASSLEKYYRENGEYPSVAAMTSTDVSLLKQKLGVSDASVFKLPMANASATTSLAVSNPSATTLVYSANTTDISKNTQCQTDINGYCDGYTLAYVKEADGTTKTIQSLHATFVAVKTDCDAGDTQSGSTCTHTYTGTYQAGSYTCPSGGTLSGTTCTRTYAATYASGGSGYYCSPAEGTYPPDDYQGVTTITRSGSTCYSTYTFPASWSSYYCPNTANGEVVSGGTCIGHTTYTATMTPSTGGYYTCPSGGSVSGPDCILDANTTITYSCPHSSSDTLNAQYNCRHERPNYTTKSGCESAGYTWGGSNCFSIHSSDANTSYWCYSGWSPFSNGTKCAKSATYVYPTYSCPSGGTLSGTTCTVTTSYAASPVYFCNGGGTLSGSNCTTSGSFAATYWSNSGYYYCSGSDTLSGSNCTNTYSATAGSGYYICPSGGVASGSTCSYTYQLQG